MGRQTWTRKKGQKKEKYREETSYRNSLWNDVEGPSVHGHPKNRYSDIVAFWRSKESISNFWIKSSALTSPSIKARLLFFFWEKLPLHSGKQDAFPFSRLYLSWHNSNCSCKPRFPEGTETKGTLSNSKPTLHCVLKSLSYPLFRKPAVLFFDIPAYCS